MSKRVVTDLGRFVKRRTSDRYAKFLYHDSDVPSLVHEMFHRNRSLMQGIAPASKKGIQRSSKPYTKKTYTRASPLLFENEDHI